MVKCIDFIPPGHPLSMSRIDTHLLSGPSPMTAPVYLTAANLGRAVYEPQTPGKFGIGFLYGFNREGWKPWGQILKEFPSQDHSGFLFLPDTKIM